MTIQLLKKTWIQNWTNYIHWFITSPQEEQFDVNAIDEASDLSRMKQIMSLTTSQFASPLLFGTDIQIRIISSFLDIKFHPKGQ